MNRQLITIISIVLPVILVAVFVYTVISLNAGAPKKSTPPRATSTPSITATNCETLPLDIEVVLDSSSSMASVIENRKSKVGNAKDAVSSLIRNLEASGGLGATGKNRFGLITFQGRQASVVIPLGSTLRASELEAKLEEIEASGTTPMKSAFTTAIKELTDNKRTDTTTAYKKVTILISDGKPMPSESQTPTAEQIASLKSLNDAVFAIATDASVNDLMTSIANPVDMAKKYTTADQLTTLFADIVNDVRCEASDLIVTKTVDNQTPAKDATITYTLKVSSNDYTNNTVKVQDALPAGLSLVSATSSSADRTQEKGLYKDGVWSVSTLLPNRQIELSIKARVDAEAGTEITNTAVGSVEGVTDLNPADNTASVKVVVSGTQSTPTATAVVSTPTATRTVATPTATTATGATTTTQAPAQAPATGDGSSFDFVWLSGGAMVVLGTIFLLF